MRPEDFVKSLPVTALKLDRRDLQPRIHHAPGITDWTIFRQSLLLQLPHHWANPSDAALKMAHFERRHVGARKAFPAPGASVVAGVGAAVKAFFPSSSSLSGKAAVAGRSRRAGGLLANHGRFTGIETPPLAATAVLPHDASEHTEHPNVLVAHTRNGLEVVALRTGAPMTSLALAKGRAYADVDGDGKDEIIYGSMTLKSDGTGLYTTGLGHGDAIHVSDLDPSRPGLEVFAIQERFDDAGANLRDARTGEVLWRKPSVFPAICMAALVKSLYFLSSSAFG
jgi:hypothetical protein